MQRIYAAAIFALFACASSPVFAQSAPLILPGGCGTASLVTGTGYPTVDSTGKLCVNATVSASITPFTPGVSGARGTPLTVTTADSSGTLPTNGGAVVVTNTGSNPMFCNVNGVAATTSDQEISASGGWFNFGIPAGTTTLHCIATGGSTTANALGGSGLATGTGGGSGGGGGGGNVNITGINGSTPSATVPLWVSPATGSTWSITAASGEIVAGAGVDGWDLTQGAKGDTAWVSGSGSVIAILKNIAGGVAGSIPGGSAIIGKVGIDQTTPGTTNGVSIQYSGVAAVADPCKTATKISIPISITTNTTTNILTGTAAQKIYVCHLLLSSAAADNVAIIQGTTGGTCGSGTLGLIGGVTAANGLNFAANGGVSIGSGDSQVLQTTVANNDICLITSAVTPLAGTMTYVKQ